MDKYIYIYIYIYIFLQSNEASRWRVTKLTFAIRLETNTTVISPQADQFPFKVTHSQLYPALSHEMAY